MNEELQRLIQERIDQLSIGIEFEISELLVDRWENVNPTRIGKEFKEMVVNGGTFQNVEFIDKKSDNHSVYRRL